MKVGVRRYNPGWQPVNAIVCAADGVAGGTGETVKSVVPSESLFTVTLGAVQFAVLPLPGTNARPLTLYATGGAAGDVYVTEPALNVPTLGLLAGTMSV